MNERKEIKQGKKRESIKILMKLKKKGEKVIGRK